MDWLTGGDGGGWEDDEDLGDLSDQSLEEQESENYEHDPDPGDHDHDHVQEQEEEPPPYEGGVALGGGMFMGRLTRFLEAVTQPGNNEEDDYEGEAGEGWGDDELGELEDEEISQTPQESSWMPSEPGVEPGASLLVDSGWDDDLDLSFEPQPEDQPEPASYSTAPLNDISSERKEDRFGRNVSFGDVPEHLNSGESGWAEDDGLDDVIADHILVEETMPTPSRQISSLSSIAITDQTVDNSTCSALEETMTENLIMEETMPFPSRQLSSLSDAAKSERTVANSKSSGWDNEDDQDLDETTTQIIVDHTPPPAPPPHLSETSPSRETSGTYQTQSVSFAGASAVAIAPSSIMDDGWDETDDVDVLVDELDETRPVDTKEPSVVLSNIPPPPPPRLAHDEATSQAVSFAARSIGAVASSTASGWDDDDENMDELDELDIQENGEDNVVDITPPPPLPRDVKSAISAIAIAVSQDDKGWDVDEDDLGEIDIETEAVEDNTPLVDHTPPPPPPTTRNIGQDTRTDVAVADEEDDISRDDTLSIANSRVRYEESQLSQHPQGAPLVDQIPASLKPISLTRTETTDAIKSSNSIGSSTIDEHRPSGDSASLSAEDSTPLHLAIVDHTPSVGLSRIGRDSSGEESMIVLNGGANATSSVAESWDSLSDRLSDVRPRNRRMVDHTPSGPRFHRGMPIDTSMAVAGHTSVGESLDSIYEEDEEPDSPARQAASTPASVEAGLGRPHRQPGDEYIININHIQADNTTIPYGSAMTPTVTSLGGRIPPTTLEDEEDDDDCMPLVDHTPLPLIKNMSIAASIDVLSVSSEEGDLGESIVGMDDVKEDLYGQVVDHTPATPNPSNRPSVGTIGLVIGAAVKQEDDTVVGVAENVDVEKDIIADDEMDDESSRGTKTTLEEYENRSLISTVRMIIPDEKQLVDHVPVDRKIVRTADASTVVFADASTTSSQVGDDIANDDDTSPAGFGPIVDHTPSVHFRSARSVATSVVTQTSGLDVDLKDDEDLDNTIGPGASTEGDDGLEIEQNTLLPNLREEKHLVDHVPSQTNRHLASDGSLRVMVDVADDITQVDTIAEDAAVDFGPIVDHTPFTARSSIYSIGASIATLHAKPEEDLDNTTAVGATSTVGGDGWDNDIPDLENISAGEEGSIHGIKETTLVDHVPKRSFSRPADASTMALVDPADVASTEGYDDTPGINGGESRFGPVVDHTPTPPASGAQVSIEESMRVQANELAVEKCDAVDDDMEDGGTWFGASTIGGVSTVGASGEASSAGENSSRGEWEEDGDVLDELGSPTTASRCLKRDSNHVVDHVPNTTIQLETDASIMVMVDPSVASSHQKEEIDDTIDVGTFGAVVDHTPSVTRPSHHSVANSMATMVTGLAADIKYDEDMDEATWNGGGSAVDEGWDQEEAELQELVDADEDRMPPLVDHVPERPESRPTDASTFVAGDPSEIFSQVDDLGQDETHFGPVVDQLPLAQYSVYASAAGSTIVNIASVVEDDLDVAVEKAIDGDDMGGDAEEQMGWQETLPNPQSGNDEDNQDREQLVDYVPDEQEEEIPDLVRDGSSEMATIGEKSTMLPADDPKEDEFGPVVDQLPITEEGSSPSAPLSIPAVSSVGRDRRRTQNGSLTGVPNIDSVAPNFSVESKASKDDGLEEDEFGPVVDHLPTSSSRASFTPSRGGSTVDALATVSEVEDDYVAGDGWEDDVDIDVADPASPIAPNRLGEDRNLSVKWIDGLTSKHATGISTTTSDSDYFDAEMGDSARVPLNETRYYDPELGDTNVWGSLNFDDGDGDGDDTPPSTPRSSFESRQVVGSTSSIAKQVSVSVSTGDCKICANSSTADCPCIKRLLAVNQGKQGMIGTLKTPEGNSLIVNFDKLLETEMIKRRLVEREFQALRTTIESLKSSKDTLVLAGETQMDVLNKMKSSNSSLSNELEEARAQADGLRAQNHEFMVTNKTLEEQLAALDQEKRKLETECFTLRRDMEVLKAKLAQLSSSTTSNLSARENELQFEISKWKSANEELSHRIARFETECESLRGKNESLYEDLEAYRQSISRLEEDNAALLSKESSLTVELKHLKESQQSQSIVTTGTFQTQIDSLRSEVAARSGECAELASQVASFQKKLVASEAEKFKQTKELARLDNDKLKIIADFEIRISKTKAEMNDLMKRKDATLDDLNTQVKAESQLVQKLLEEKATLEKKNKADAMTHQLVLADKSRQISAIESLSKAASARIEALEKEKQRMTREIADLLEATRFAETRCKDFSKICQELDEMKVELNRKDETICQMKTQISQYDQGMDDNVSKWQREISILQRNRDNLASDLRSSQKIADEAMQSVSQIASEKERLEHVVKEMECKCKLLEEQAQQTYLDENKISSVMKTELQELRNVLSEVHHRNKILEREQSEHSNKHAEVEIQLATVMAELDNLLSQKSLVNSNLETSEQQVRSLTNELMSMKADRQQLQSQYEELQSSLCKFSTDQKSFEDLSFECNSLRRELAEARSTSMQLEEQSRTLKNEVAMSRSLLAEKERSLFILNEQQEVSQVGTIDLQNANKMLLGRIDDLLTKIQEFEVERAELNLISEEQANNMERINTELEIVSKERDTFLEERNMFEEENEEMLVQFGLFKEEMDKTDHELEQLRTNCAAWKKSAQDAERELKATEVTLDNLMKSRKDEADQALASMEAAKNLFSHEKEKLTAAIQEVTRNNSVLEDNLQNATSEKVRLLAQLEELQKHVSGSIAKSEAKESRLMSMIEDMEDKYQELTDKGYVQEKTISELQASLDQSESYLQDAVELRNRLSEVEQSLADSERLVNQKDGAIEDLKYQLENAGKAPAESVELETLRRTVREMEESAERDRANIQELEQISDKMTRDLRKTADQLSSTELLVSQLRNDVEAKRRKEQEIEKLQERLVATEQRLERATQDASSSRSESTDLRGRLVALQAELEDYRRMSQQPAKEPSGQSSAEMLSLRQQIEMLKQQQLASSSQTGAREELIEREVHLLQQQMRQKDGEISKLQCELQNLGSDLSHKHEELENKQQHVDKLSLELEDLRSQATQPATSLVLELTRDEAENAEKMRSQIISLAKALEQSEGRRAVAIERLETERQANAESLRRLTESVKRFYSTLSIGDN